MDRPDGTSSSGPVSQSGRASTSTSGHVEWLLVVALLAVPMAIVPGGNDAPTLVSIWGFVTLSGDGGGLGGYPVWAYFLDQPRPFATLPPSIRAWPLAIGFHMLAAASDKGGGA
ncbi:MAG: TIGR04206 family protein, partial [Methanobacteriota archaeon]